MYEFRVAMGKRVHTPKLYALGLSRSLFLSNTAKMWTKATRLMKSCARDRGTKLLYSRFTQLSNFCQRCGWQTHAASVALPGIFRQSIYAANFTRSTFSERFDQLVVRSIFAQRALRRCNARTIKKGRTYWFLYIKIRNVGAIQIKFCKNRFDKKIAIAWHFDWLRLVESQ